MKLSSLLPLAVVGSAFVLPSQEVFSEIALEEHSGSSSWAEEAISAGENVIDEWRARFADVAESTGELWDSTKDVIGDVADEAFDQARTSLTALEPQWEKVRDTASDAASWAESSAESISEFVADRPRHPRDPHRKPNLTVYQLIAGSKYTTKLAKLINQYDDLVDALNSTKANFTVFAPIDKAFEKIPENAPKPSKQFIKALLGYHVVPELYPGRRVLAGGTAPTLDKSESLGYKPRPQRLSFQLGLRGLTVNFYSRVIAADITGTNGIIHGVDSILVPPPNIIDAIDLFPGEFSTLELGLDKTDLLDKLNTTDHAGGTFFAPSNFAFQKLGARANAFLFSRYGLKYLKALLEYHVVPERTLYSDAYYDASQDKDDDDSDDAAQTSGYFHVDLPTLLEGRSIAVDILRYGPFVRVKLNAFSRVTVADGCAKDGVLHVISDVLIPPRKVGGKTDESEYWHGGEIEPEELIERLSPFVPKDDL